MGGEGPKRSKMRGSNLKRKHWGTSFYLLVDIEARPGTQKTFFSRVNVITRDPMQLLDVGWEIQVTMQPKTTEMRSRLTRYLTEPVEWPRNVGMGLRFGLQWRQVQQQADASERDPRERDEVYHPKAVKQREVFINSSRWP